jgi:nitric oxide reductase subunit B|tara:strand:- start:2942 stop:4315 length:1374 start_codon:yes stop_codon:yes gene_type:complete
VSEATTASRAFVWMALLALGACAVTIVSGTLAALTYTDSELVLRSAQLTLQQLRPVHETFAFAWVFLGGVAIVYFYLHHTFGPPSAAMRRRTVWQIVLWTVAGLGILVTLLSGRFTGREYLGYHPAFSVLILAGWLLFAWNFFEQSGISLSNRPAYIYMWSIAIPLFVITYLEGHLYLFDVVSGRPVRDIAIQWKANGTLVGSFNLLAYGSLMWVSGRIRGDDGYAHSRTAFALLFVGVLNTFTNYGHHTYHLPQTAWIHWISFVISMLEVIILAKVFLDVLALLWTASDPQAHRVSQWFIRSATMWTFVMTAVAIALAVPPLNTLIHGTHVVVAHSMGSMLGIDSMILWAALAYGLEAVLGSQHPVVCGRRVRLAAPLLSLFLFVFLLSYLARGAAAGWARYVGPSAPDFSWLIAVFPGVMALSGIGLAVTVLWIVAQWMVALWSAMRPTHKEGCR